MPERKQRIEQAIKDRDVRTACHIVDAVQHLLDLVEDQPPGVIEAMLDHVREMQRATGHRVPPWRKKLREGILAAGEAAVSEARKREDSLYRAITGNGR
jgi:hypothetical protein